MRQDLVESLPDRGTEPADDLLRRLQALRDRLGEITRCDADADADRCLARVRAYLLGELVPAIESLHLRVQPALRRELPASPDGADAAEHARLLRLTDRVVALQQEVASRPGRPLELEDLTRELATLADRHLARAQRALPEQLRRLPASEAAELLAAAARTAEAVRAAPHFELAPALL